MPSLPTLKITDRPVTHDAELLAQSERDPLAYRGRVLARTGNEMRLAGEAIQQHASRLRVPFYIFHGTADHLADWRGSMLLFGRASSEDKTVTLFSGLYHETMNELSRDRVLRGITCWLDEHIASGSTLRRQT